ARRNLDGGRDARAGGSHGWQTGKAPPPSRRAEAGQLQPVRAPSRSPEGRRQRQEDVRAQLRRDRDDHGWPPPAVGVRPPSVVGEHRIALPGSGLDLSGLEGGQGGPRRPANPPRQATLGSSQKRQLFRAEVAGAAASLGAAYGTWRPSGL